MPHLNQVVLMMKAVESNYRRLRLQNGEIGETIKLHDKNAVNLVAPRHGIVLGSSASTQPTAFVTCGIGFYTA